MKKILAIILAVVMILSLVACGERQNFNEKYAIIDESCIGIWENTEKTRGIKINSVGLAGQISLQIEYYGVWSSGEITGTKNENNSIHFFTKDNCGGFLYLEPDGKIVLTIHTQPNESIETDVVDYLKTTSTENEKYFNNNSNTDTNTNTNTNNYIGDNNSTSTYIEEKIITHVAVCGAVIIGQDGRSYKYYEKCENCGHVISNITKNAYGSSGRFCSSFYCHECGERQEVIIEHHSN